MITQILTCLFTTISRFLNAEEPNIVSIRKIWDHAPHNAFTDLIYFRNCWWSTFREAQDHGSSNGTVSTGNYVGERRLLEVGDVD